MLQAHGRLGRLGRARATAAAPAGPRAPLFSAAAPPPAASAAGRARLLARAAPEGEGKEAPAPAPAAAPPATPERKGDGLDYVAHPFGTGRLTSDDEEGASRSFRGGGVGFFLKGFCSPPPLLAKTHTLTNNPTITDLDVLEIKEIRHMLKKR